MTERIQTYVIDSLAAIEDALTKPPLCQWESLLESDSTATLFQSPVWCIPWYQSYPQFDPRVVVVNSGSRLVGVVPLAIEKKSGRLTFAGDNLADYKDVVTLPEFREDVLGAVLRYIGSTVPRQAFYFGSTQPESESPAVLHRIAGKCGAHVIARINAGWRWWPGEQAEDPLKKKSVRYPINYFKRLGELSCQYLQSIEEWDSFKEDYYRQHTLRQIFGGRPASFNTPEKRAFFDRLVRTPYAHVSALRLNQELIAGHFGYVYRDVLYWGAPSFDIRYYQYSPGLVQLVLTMKSASDWGLAGIDLTIGEGDLKERFSTSRVDLPFIEIYSRPSTYYSRTLSLRATNVVKSVVTRFGGGEAWKKRVRPVLVRLTGRTRPAPADDSIAPSNGAAVITLRATPGSLRAVELRLEAGEQAVFHRNQVYDLLQRGVMEDEGARKITKAARAYAEALKTGKVFHTVLIGDRLAAWSYTSRQKATEPGGNQAGEANHVVFEDLYTLPEFRGRRLAGALAAHIAEEHFREGAAAAVIAIPQGADAARKSLARVGFVDA